MLNGLTNATFQNIQLNSGVFLKNVDVSAATDKSALETLILTELDKENNPNVLGATRGGGTFQCTPTTRYIDADGLRSAAKAALVIEGWDVRLTTTLLEIRPGTLKDALMCADSKTTGNVTTLTIREAVKSTDFIDTLLWFGDTNRGAVVIEVYNAINMSGANFTFTDKGEGTLPVEYHAHVDTVGMKSDGLLPVKVHFLDEATT